MTCDDDMLVEDLFDEQDLSKIDGIEPPFMVDMAFFGVPGTTPAAPSRAKSNVSRTHLASESTFGVFDLEPVPLQDKLQPTCNHPSKQIAALWRALQLVSPPIDTTSLIPDELLCDILSFLDVESLSVTRTISKRLNRLGSRDQSGWSLHCAMLWKGKVSIPSAAREARQEGNSLNACRLSVHDGNSRQEISLEELCFDPETGKGTIWYFRFKESAGAAWTSFDPWHAGLPCRKMVFLGDGTVQELVADSSTPYSFRVDQPFLDAPNRHHLAFMGDEATTEAEISMKWRFLSSPMDTPSRPRGAYVRLNVAGRDVPTYIARRSPTGNWGFVLENCWGLFASFPLPRKLETGRSLPIRPTRMRLRRTSDGGVRWLNVEGIESDSDDTAEVDEHHMTTDGRLLRDSALPITSRQQWREALLYNYGSVTLPEGEAARAEFDRIFASYRSPISSLDNRML